MWEDHMIHEKKNARSFYCEEFGGSVSQEPYMGKSAEDPLWRCLGNCSVVGCEYNLGPRTLLLRQDTVPADIPYATQL